MTKRPRPVTFVFASLFACLAFVAIPALAQGDLETLQKGHYRCGLPGDATGQAWVEDPALAFSVVSGSRYTTARGEGAYLLQGDELTFTRGPMKGMKLRRTNSGILQQVMPDGSPGRLRCHRAGPLNH